MPSPRAVPAVAPAGPRSGRDHDARLQATRDHHVVRSARHREWLAKPRQRRWHLHFTPTSSSWLNLVERWFKELTDKQLRRSSFTSVDHLIDTIDEWAEHWNDNPHPFIWHKTAEEIIAKVRRGRTALAEAKSATHH